MVVLEVLVNSKKEHLEDVLFFMYNEIKGCSIVDRVKRRPSMNARNVINEVNKVMVGKEEVVRKIWLALLAKGHVLLEDVPGVGKTTLAKAFAKTLGMQTNRMQFTPDVMASDIVGFRAPHLKDGTFEVHKGAIFCNLFLADEINRASSRTQAALLEVMEENQITIDGVTYDAHTPFHVIATQNPYGSGGTQRLPENQIDRFMICISLGYPSSGAEIEMLLRKQRSQMYEPKQVCTQDEMIKMQEEVEKVYVHEDLVRYIVLLVQKTRTHAALEMGASPRASIALMAMAKANAFLSGRNYVVSEDIKYVFEDVMCHRILLKDKNNTRIKQEIIKEILNVIPQPYLGKNET